MSTPSGVAVIEAPSRSIVSLSRLRRAWPVILSLVVFGLALEVLRAELRAVGWHDLTRDALGTPPLRLALALGLTTINYLVLTGYDLLAFRYIGSALPRRQIMGAAFLAYAISHNVGFAALSGASVRYRFYSRWGISAEDLSKIVFSYSVTFWIGLFALGGVSLIVSPPPAMAGLPGDQLVRAIGWLLIGGVAAYLVAASLRREPIRLRRLEFPMPSLAMAMGQLALSVLDWSLAGAVIYVLLPAGVPFLAFLGAFLVAILIGMASHVPGGLGVFEGMMVLLLKPWLTAPDLLPVFVVYRAVYYLLPFAVGLIALVADEMHQQRTHLARAVGWMGEIARQVTPRVLAASTFLSGLVLLLSGATPASPGRLDLLDRLLPLGVIETSHFLGSVAGAGLLVLSHGLARRLDAAYYLSSTLIVVGMGASLLKGFDFEEAALLLIVLVVLRQSRTAFDRRAAFFETRFSPAWIAALVGAVAASVWLGFFAFKHVDYSADLWWQFEWSGEASRFLRASVGASVVVLLIGLARLVGHSPHEIAPPDEEQLARASAAIERQSSTNANLVFLRDKGLLFDAARTAFVMYGVQGGRGWRWGIRWDARTRTPR